MAHLVLSEAPVRAALAGRRVLVTGCTGFKGTWLTAWLLRLGAEVRGLSLPPPTRPALWEQAGLAQEVPWAVVDLRHRRAVESAVRQAAPELVFHLAAEARVPRARRRPVQTFATNVMGTVHLLEAVRALGQPCGVVHVSSDKCYAPHPDGRPHREDDALGGHEPYAASKAAAELVVESWRRSWFSPETIADHGVAVASARAGNAIGPGDHAPDRLVPDVLRALEAGQTLALRQPGARRPWQHVLAPLWGYLLLGAALVPGAPARTTASRAWNFGPPAAEARTVAELVHALERRWGHSLSTCRRPPPGPETAALRLDAAQARALLGWTSPWSLDRSLDELVLGVRALAAGEGRAVLEQALSAWARDLARRREAAAGR